MGSLLRTLLDAFAGRPVRFHPPQAGCRRPGAVPEPTLPSGVSVREFYESVARSHRDVAAMRRRLRRIRPPPDERLPCLCAYLRLDSAA